MRAWDFRLRAILNSYINTEGYRSYACRHSFTGAVYCDKMLSEKNPEMNKGEAIIMRIILRAARPVSIFLTVIIALTAVSHRYATAAMVGTETIVQTTRGEEGRRFLYGILAREEVKSAFIAQGIDLREAHERVASLTDAEVILLADKIDQLPAGGDAIGAVIGAALIVFLVLLITDLMGLTDVFPFVKKHR